MRTKNNNLKVKSQSRDWTKIVEAAKSARETNNKLIKDLSLWNINVRIRKNGIVETDNKDPVLLANPPTPMPKD